MLKFAELIFGASLLLLLAGCATTPREETGPPPAEITVTNAVVVPPKPVVIRPVLPPATNNSSDVHVNLPPKITRPAPILTWTSLNNWAVRHKLSPPRKVASSPITAYAIGSPKGVMTLIIGSREATWNGVGIHLGYAPEVIDNQLFVYGLDLQKNLEPLLVNEPLTFGTNRVVVIDPGHGGINGGTISVLDKRPEKDFTLDCARRLKPLLEASGCQVFLTHTNDVDVALSNRVTFAEMHHASLFISLHFNSAAPSHRESGLETYCLTPVGLPSTLTRGNPDFLFQSFPNNDSDEANIQLAMRLHTAVLRASGEEDRGVRRARFMGVLHGQRRPAVLIEGGFLSNPSEAQHIENADFRQKIAEAIANVLR